MWEIINGVISWLNSNGSAVTAISTFILAIITGFYILETRKQNSIAVRPYPQLNLMPENTEDGRFLFLYIENIGRGPLICSTIKLVELGDESISKKVVLAVDKQTKIKLDEEEKYRNHKKVKINIKYNDIYGKKYQEDSDLETHITDSIKIYSKNEGKHLTKDD